MKHIHFSLIIALTAVFYNLGAQTPEEIMNEFFKTYQKNEPTKALDDLYGHNPWMERMKDDVDKLKTQFKDLKTLVGEYNGHQLLYQKNVKEVFFLATYIVKYDRQPVRMNFQFYKPKDEWTLYSFSYDDNFDDDLENAIKYEILEMTK